MRAFVALAILLLYGCAGSVDESWASAERQGSESAYRTFRTRFPDSPQAAIAEARIAQIEANTEWMSIEKVLGHDGLTDHLLDRLYGYLEKWPDSERAPDIKSLIGRIEAEPLNSPSPEQPAISIEFDQDDSLLARFRNAYPLSNEMYEQLKRAYWGRPKGGWSDLYKLGEEINQTERIVDEHIYLVRGDPQNSALRERHKIFRKYLKDLRLQYEAAENRRDLEILQMWIGIMETQGDTREIDAMEALAKTREKGFF